MCYACACDAPLMRNMRFTVFYTLIIYDISKMEEMIKKQIIVARTRIESFWDDVNEEIKKDDLLYGYLTVCTDLLKFYGARVINTHEVLVVCKSIEFIDYIKMNVYMKMKKLHTSAKTCMNGYLRDLNHNFI